MSRRAPRFLRSEYFYYDKNGKMALKEGAPKEVVEEFKKYLEFRKKKRRKRRTLLKNLTTLYKYEGAIRPYM